MPSVTVRLYAQLREALGAESVTVDVVAGSTADDLRRQLFSGPLLDLPVGYAINHALVCKTTVVSDGDEVVFLPPVGGG